MPCVVPAYLLHVKSFEQCAWPRVSPPEVTAGTIIIASSWAGQGIRLGNILAITLTNYRMWTGKLTPRLLKSTGYDTPLGPPQAR